MHFFCIKPTFFVMCLLVCGNAYGLYLNEYPRQKLENKINTIIDDMLEDEQDVCLATFVENRRSEIIQRCTQRIPQMFFRTDDYCDQQGTLGDHVRKQALITRADFLSGEAERISDLVTIPDHIFHTVREKKKFKSSRNYWFESDEDDDTY